MMARVKMTAEERAEWGDGPSADKLEQGISLGDAFAVLRFLRFDRRRRALMGEPQSAAVDGLIAKMQAAVAAASTADGAQLRLF